MNPYKKIVAIQIAFIAVGLQIAWQITNNELPISDGGDHFRIAYLIYLGFRDGLLQGVDFFLHSGGKPILFSAFAAPFVSLFRFNDLLPVATFIVIV